MGVVAASAAAILFFHETGVKAANLEAPGPCLQLNFKQQKLLPMRLVTDPIIHDLLGLADYHKGVRINTLHKPLEGSYLAD